MTDEQLKKMITEIFEEDLEDLEKMEVPNHHSAKTKNCLDYNLLGKWVTGQVDSLPDHVIGCYFCKLNIMFLFEFQLEEGAQTRPCPSWMRDFIEEKAPYLVQQINFE